MRKVTASDSYSVADAHRDVWEAILRVVARDMEMEIEAGERLMREGKGTPDGMMSANHIPTCVAATKEILADMRWRAAPASRTEETRLCKTCGNYGCMGDVKPTDRAKCKTLNPPASASGVGSKGETPGPWSCAAGTLLCPGREYDVRDGCCTFCGLSARAALSGGDEGKGGTTT